MKLRAGHMVLAVLALVVWASCKEGPRRIPRDKMVDIYSDMFLQDQAVRLKADLRKQADTVLVYGGIFQKYGYNVDDYLYSVEYYLRDPERMAKLMAEVGNRMGASARAMNEEVEFYEWSRVLMTLYAKPVSDKLPRQVSLADKGRVIRDSTGSGQYFRYRPEEGPQLDTLVIRLD